MRKCENRAMNKLQNAAIRKCNNNKKKERDNGRKSKRLISKMQITKSLDSLPAEVLEKILKFDVISYIDLCRLSCVSRFFSRSISALDDVWHAKFTERWPTAEKTCDHDEINWRELFEVHIQYQQKLHSVIDKLMIDFYSRSTVPNEAFNNLLNIVCDGDSFGEYFLLDELKWMIFKTAKHTNLTRKYYGKKILRYLLQNQMMDDWKNIIKRETNLPLLNGACRVQKYFEPLTEECTNQVYSKINELTAQVFDVVKEFCPDHPLIERGFPRVFDPEAEKKDGDVNSFENEDKILEKSLWTTEECKLIIDCINRVLYTILDWTSTKQKDLNSPDLVYIDKVIQRRTGSPVTQCVIYETIANQLGVKLFPIIFPQHCFLKWLHCPEMPLVEESWIYIDIADCGKFKNILQLKHLIRDLTPVPSKWFQPVSSVEVSGSICRNLVQCKEQEFYSGGDQTPLRSAAELRAILCPNDMDNKVLLARLYIHTRSNYDNVLSLLNDVPENHSNQPMTMNLMQLFSAECMENQRIDYLKLQGKIRTRKNVIFEVKFAVGMLVTHIELHIRCVVIDWESHRLQSDTWTRNHDADLCAKFRQQPFYHLLGSDGKFHYAAQESLKFDWKKLRIHHPHIGRYFKSFHGNYYMPNEPKQAEYPEDIEFRKHLFIQHNS